MTRRLPGVSGLAAVLGALVLQAASAAPAGDLPLRMRAPATAEAMATPPPRSAPVTVARPVSGPSPASAVLAARATPAPAPARPMLALVIDDIGWNAGNGERVLALPGPLTVAVLPGTPSAVPLAERAARRGHEVILHQPMEALDARWPGPGAMNSDHDADELRRLLAANLAEIPYRVGVSNHMGSRLTAQPGAMATLMGELAPRNLYFLDSRTTPDTVAMRTAEAHSVPAARRDVFLDPVIEAAVIERALDDALALAERRGHALAIGHPHDETLRVLEARMDEIRARVELVPVSRLVDLHAGPGVAPVSVAAQ